MGTQNKLTSKTLWFNALIGIAGVVLNSGVVGNLPVSPATQVGVVAAGNFILRFFTTQPLSGIPDLRGPGPVDAGPAGGH